MSKSIILDAGHGGTDPGAKGFGVMEKEWNLKMTRYQYERLNALGVKVDVTRTGDQSLDSVLRTYRIKDKYDYCISNHFNAFNGSARGIETIHSIHGGKAFATAIANELKKVSGLPLRRVFTRATGKIDYYFMHRLTGNTRTIIVEYGFIDNQEDHDWYKNEANFFKAAEAVVKVICNEVGVKYVTPKKTQAVKPKGKLFKVQVGAFSQKANAERLAAELKKDGYGTYIVEE